MSKPGLELEHVQVDVEPLNEPRWARIERGMFARLDASGPPADEAVRAGRLRRTAVWSGAGVAVAALAFVVVRRAGMERLPEPARLVTTSSPSRFTIGESSLVVAPGSLVLVNGDDEHGIEVVLDRGAVTCEVAPRHGRPAFIVDAGEVRVRVVGTRFTVAREAAEISVAVDHGVVDVAAGGTVTVLHDGERWPLVGEPSSPSPVGSSTSGANGAASALEAALSPAAAPATSSFLAPALTPALAPAPSFAAAPGPAPAVVPSLVPIPPASRPAFAPALVPPPASASALASAPALSLETEAQQLFESAARVERSRPDDAAAMYRRVGAGTAGWAPSALFALGRLEADRERKTEAVRVLGEYVARYPRGINVEDARELLQHAR